MVKSRAYIPLPMGEQDKDLPPGKQQMVEKTDGRESPTKIEKQA